MNIKKIVKNNKFLLLGIIIGLVISATMVYAANILYSTSEISFDNTNSRLLNNNNEITVEEAINALYDEALEYGCPNDRTIARSDSGVGYKCINKSFAMTPGYTCIRASWLHKVDCVNKNYGYCNSDGYTSSGSMGTSIITYGKLGTQGGNLQTGDAFDCDVNGNGYIDVDENGFSTERFYYVSPRWNAETYPTTSYDTSIAVLIYYSNTYDGQISKNTAAYATLADIQEAYPNETISSYDNCHGPVTARKHLPKTIANGGTWQDFVVKNSNNESKRTLIACWNSDCSTMGASTSAGSLPQDFSYEGYAARLLTVQELKRSGCHTLSGKSSMGEEGSLKACNFFMEGTYYSDIYNQTDGMYFETPYGSSNYNVWHIRTVYRDIYNYNNVTATAGIRPVIEVPVSSILK